MIVFSNFDNICDFIVILYDYISDNSYTSMSFDVKNENG